MTKIFFLYKIKYNLKILYFNIYLRIIIKFKYHKKLFFFEC